MVPNQQKQYMTCQSTMSNYAKNNDLNEGRMNPHSSIQTQMLPQGGANGSDPFYVNMIDDHKSNT